MFYYNLCYIACSTSTTNAYQTRRDDRYENQR